MTHMTDDNDNLIKLGEDGPDVDLVEEEGPRGDWFRDGVGDPEDEWTETAGGFAKINVDLDLDVIAGLVDCWARDNLHPASLEVYEEKKALVDSAKPDSPDAISAQPLYDAVVNDIIIVALTEQIERAEAEKALDNAAEDV